MATRTGASERAASRAKRKTERLVDRIEQRLPGPLRRIVETSRGDDILLFAAGLAFYALISIVPLVIFVAWLSGLVLGEERVHQVAQRLQSAAPQNLEVGQFLERVAELGNSLGVTAILVGLWPATSYGAGLRRAFHRLSVTNRREMEGLRGRGLALLVLLPLFVLGSLVGAYAGTALVGNGIAAGFLGAALALVAGFVGAAVGAALIYRIFPPEPMSWREIGVGVLWSAGSIAILSLGFALFIGLGANFQEHYASSGMAALVLLGLWLFLANALLLVGYRLSTRS